MNSASARKAKQQKLFTLEDGTETRIMPGDTISLVNICVSGSLIVIHREGKIMYWRVAEAIIDDKELCEFIRNKRDFTAFVRVLSHALGFGFKKLKIGQPYLTFKFVDFSASN